jgi:hypothetical protein
VGIQTRGRATTRGIETDAEPEDSELANDHDPSRPPRYACSGVMKCRTSSRSASTRWIEARPIACEGVSGWTRTRGVHPVNEIRTF